jgi:hypothetical protein
MFGHAAMGGQFCERSAPMAASLGGAKVDTEGGDCSNRLDEADSVERSDDPQDPRLDGRSFMAQRQSGHRLPLRTNRAACAIHGRRHLLRANVLAIRGLTATGSRDRFRTSRGTKRMRDAI